MEPVSAPEQGAPANARPKPADPSTLKQDAGKKQHGKGKLGSLENPEVYENVPGHVIPILEREFDDFDTEAASFLRGEQTEEQFIGFRLKQGVYGQRQPDVQMIRVKLPYGGAPTRSTGARLSSSKTRQQPGGRARTSPASSRAPPPAAAGAGRAAGRRSSAGRGWAERVAVPSASLAALPDDISDTAAAALPLAGLTALRLLRVTGSLAGQRVLLTGASGGVGHYVTELAATQGAELTAVARSRDRGERLRELGAATVVSEVEKADGPFDVIFESVGGDSLPAAWRRLTTRGLLVWFGQASRIPPELNFFDWSGGASATLRKFYYADSDTTDADDLATLVRLTGAATCTRRSARSATGGRPPGCCARCLAARSAATLSWRWLPNAFVKQRCGLLAS